MKRELSFDEEQLAAALELFKFGEDDVLEAIRLAQQEGSAQVGHFPMQGQAQHQLFAVLSVASGRWGLSLLAFDTSVECTEPGYVSAFSASLRLRTREVLLGVKRCNADGTTPTQNFELNNPADLIGAQFEFVA